MRVIEPQSGLGLGGMGGKCWGLLVKEGGFGGGGDRGFRGLQRRVLWEGVGCMICKKKKERPKLS